MLNKIMTTVAFVSFGYIGATTLIAPSIEKAFSWTDQVEQALASHSVKR